MPLLGFKKRFAPAVESGKKRQTIRARRKDGRDPKAGDILFLYSGLRTKQCHQLGVEKCKAVLPIRIDFTSIEIKGRELDVVERRLFSVADGFGSFDELVDWFVNEAGRDLPWRGIVVYW